MTQTAEDRSKLFAWIAEGARETPVPQDTGSWVHETQTGFRTRIGPFLPTALEEALRHTYVGYESIDKTFEIDPRYVLAEPWSVGKLQDARNQLAKGNEPYPIDVIGLRIAGLPVLYSVTDGMHRTAAARLAGKTSIRATVSSINICKLDSVKIYSSKAVISMEPETIAGRIWPLDPVTVEILKLSGVETRTTATTWLLKLLRGWISGSVPPPPRWPRTNSGLSRSSTR